MEKLSFAGRLIGPQEPPYIIAEIGANHNGNIDLAKQLVDAAKACGADAVKFQSWSKSSLFSNAEYERQPELSEQVERYQLAPKQHREVISYCQDKNITFLSSCFSFEEVDMLESLGVPGYKIASMDVNHLPLLDYVASKGKPVLLSTGMASLGEIERALSVLRNGGAGPVALFHCISIYPPPSYEIINLRNINTLQQAFDVPVGLSDHTLGVAIPLAAIALGASIIEKHFTLDKHMEGFDHAISADPSELEIIVREGQNVFTALGSTVRSVTEAEMEKRNAFRRQVVVRHDMKKGERLKLEDLEYKRPGTGIPPDEVAYVVGRSLKRDITAEEELQWSDLA